ncbi:MAG: hypothetical protein HDR39_03765 [Treponema sp.]|nr:hypothetical protein [Treponema sp.]
MRIRTARGEKPSSLPLPQGISEADDSDDFIGGLPRQDADAAMPDDVLADDLSAAVPGEASVQPSADEPLPDLDFLDIGGAMGDELPDLSDFLDEPVEPAPQAAVEPDAAERDPAASPDDSDGLFASSGGGIADSEDIPSVDDLLATLDLPDDAAFADDTKLTLPDELQAHDISLADAFVPETGMELAESPAPAEEAASEDMPPAAEADEPQTEADEPQADAAHEPDDTAEPVRSEDFALADDVPVEDAPVSSEAESADAATESLFDLSDLDDLPPPDDMPASEEDMPAADSDAAADDDISDVFDTSALDLPDMPSASPADDISDAAAESVPEVFDTSEMEGLDFSADASTPVSFDDIPVTGELPAGDDGFELTDDFEIPGFSDTDTVPVEKKKGGGLGVPDSSKTNPDRPPNTLTEREYEQFKKNLAAYPLNLRIAVEDFIVKDEFKDNVIFEVVEKVLKKVPARQLAGHMEKLLDIAIDVPRDYERRSVAEYEAYKQSFQYQLKNRILPMAIVGIVACIFAVFLFQAGKMFVYRPLKALSYYKQGYTMLENNEFPQSEERFAAAVSYKPMKKWFFKYARGYRDRKQYERAAQMYRNILYFFKHDKQAGLEYARMELYDRANYPRAEEIVRRDVLDYYINDADGLLLLGDIFLEWAELDPGKYEDAREQYANLIQLYGQTDLYMSRMMRYFIRTDNLQNVLMLKNRFYANKKSKKALGAQDWTELSGYLLDKLYGTLSKSEEFLRSSIEDVLDMLNMAVRLDPANPVARYNLSRYFLHNNNDASAQREMQIALDLFASAPVRTKKNTYREINGSRILGELFAEKRECLKAQEAYTRGINVFSEEHGRTGLEGDENTGHLFADLGDIDYFISGDMDSALANYQMAVATKYDIPSLNYRIGAIHYNRKQFDKALGSFVKTAETEGNDVNLLLSLGNTLSVRGDNFAAQGYYADLLGRLNDMRARDEMLFPQEHADDNELVDMYLKANNNLGVTLYRLARQTGNSGMNAEALVRLSDSMRAWDALTRNPTTMKRLEGGNLAEQNAKYLMHPYAEFEPAIYTDIPKTLSGEKVLE